MKTTKNPHAKRLRSLLCLVSIGLLAAPGARAGLLIYEGFDGYTVGSLTGQTASANTIGLTGAYQKLADPVRSLNYTATGLTFGSLQVGGGALRSNDNGNNAVIGINIDGLSHTTGTIYSSYLARVTNSGAFTGGTLSVGIGQTATSGATNRSLNSAAVGSQTSRNPAIAYGSSNVSHAASAPQIEANTTYAIVARFTNVGTTLSASNQGVATLWVLTEAQFEHFAVGGFVDAELDSATVGTGATNVFNTSTHSISSGSVSLSALQLTGNFSDALIIDEVRWGTSLDSVLPTIPEPASASAVAAGLVFLAAMTRRSR